MNKYLLLILLGVGLVGCNEPNQNEVDAANNDISDIKNWEEGFLNNNLQRIALACPYEGSLDIFIIEQKDYWRHSETELNKSSAWALWNYYKFYRHDLTVSKRQSDEFLLHIDPVYMSGIVYRESSLGRNPKRIRINRETLGYEYRGGTSGKYHWVETTKCKIVNNVELAKYKQELNDYAEQEKELAIKKAKLIEEEQKEKNKI